MGTSTETMGDGFMVVRRSMRSVEGVRMLGISWDPQPAFDKVDEGEVWPEGGDKFDEREETVEMVEALIDMFMVVWLQTEGWSVLYEVRADLACFKSCSGIHESSSAEYPFYRIRKEWEDRVLRWRMIFSISYSSCSLTRSGGGAGKFQPWTSFSR